MGTVIIFGLIALLALYGMVRSFREKNILGILFAIGTFAVFGWFTFMTVYKDGFPTGTH
ncbi:DUF2759 domain-containing protein [Parageobacillus thermoglucosidasius]|uniref:DUF2759 domain-containing protein n=3 Tax=Anoxybacillaceae TaxID=3120669 RepID=A0AAN0YS26_PARTM|nr:DUF2759 domain-containing protein [Parageobacillus thermoglucosidasius]KYD13737.1 hypothetical protein B4168_0558 [Anoxybacillus flavithermus]REK55607.1 MAG: DUF2759 domain-containing protein [Geobacillus sp.]AEH47231.1 hypothetical protein Geoth_1236 [Parageobacillus thermoglucosidasius C56-YS93]ANZ31599.1 DUF2759 domain-containing protein [Parageobacillus thermoglucosidasius]APM82337.1 DUF2759 domain-containing protein [Parageobacillus thermoglucosidasius]